MKNNRILFLTLRVFSATGGIEKVCRIIGKLLFEMTFSGNKKFDIYSSHDSSVAAKENKYFPNEFYRGFENRRLNFIWSSFRKGIKSDVVLLSHINLLPVGWLIKIFSPSTRIILIAHGIEVWYLPLGLKKKMINACDKIICVSQFTKDKITELKLAKEEKCIVINNCLDPYLPSINTSHKPKELREKYGFIETDKILFTLTRMEASERYKGYDRVMHAIAELKKDIPEIKYVIGGSYETKEKDYIDALIKDLGITENVVMTGFIPDEKLSDYFLLADQYIMPSYNEGFGIVFIEAMYYNLPVTAGNKDGSVDALLNGKLGILIDPMNILEIKNAIRRNFNNNEKINPDINLLMSNFGYEHYKKRFESILIN